MKQLILGGARSGKSKLADTLATKSGKKVVYIATGEALDAEMKLRIQQHQAQRSVEWQTVEEPIELAKALTQFNHSQYCVLVDCLTLWITNCLLSEDTHCWSAQKNALLDELNEFKGDLILVSNEAGQGIVPVGEINRQFVDESGWLHQRLAQACEKVIWVVAGLPQVLKS